MRQERCACRQRGDLMEVMRGHYASLVEVSLSFMPLRILSIDERLGRGGGNALTVLVATFIFSSHVLNPLRPQLRMCGRYLLYHNWPESSGLRLNYEEV